MELSERDLEILKLVNTFTQLSSSHLRELVFADRSHSVPDTVLKRLVHLGYLARVGRRASGDKGGATPFVYKLGRYGRILFDVESRQSTLPNNHALMMADTYLALRRAEKAGLLVMQRWEVELPVPPVRADLFVRLDYPDQRRTGNYFLEIDRKTEAPKRLREKIAGYWHAASTSEAEYFPYVVFVVDREIRQREIQRMVRQLPDDQQEMVRVFLLSELTDQLLKL